MRVPSYAALTVAMKSSARLAALANVDTRTTRERGSAMTFFIHFVGSGVVVSRTCGLSPRRSVKLICSQTSSTFAQCAGSSPHQNST